MARKVISEIIADYSKYRLLVDGNKDCNMKVIELSRKRGNHPNSLIETINVKHESLVEDIELIVESKIDDKRSFKFKLRARGYMPEPYFRFDSDGRAHYNKSDDTPLEEQKIDTPHFNVYDENGKEYAYHSSALKKKENIEAIINDISLGMAHFCDESNTYFRTEHIEISQNPVGELGLELDNLTSLDGIAYE